MSNLLNDEIRNQLTDLFDNLKDGVTLMVFTEKEDCETCEITSQFMQELAGLSEKISYHAFDLNDDQAQAKAYGIERVPTIVVLDHQGKDRGIRFCGIPAGHEINSLLAALIESSGQESEVPDHFQERVDQIDKPVNIKVFVTLGCPHCPGAVQKAHKLALMNPNIRAEMIEAETFRELSLANQVSSVPQIVFNDQTSLLGDVPINQYLDAIEALS